MMDLVIWRVTRRCVVV